MTDLFVGIVILAIAGNAADSTSAVRAALRGRTDLSVGIGAGSSIQIALFVAPCLVLLSRFVGPGPMDLVFTPVEVLALVLAIAVTTQVAGDGESNWLEGVQLARRLHHPCESFSSARRKRQAGPGPVIRKEAVSRRYRTGCLVSVPSFWQIPKGMASFPMKILL